MDELARRITNRIKMDAISRRKLTIGEVMTFNDIGELNAFVSIKAVSKLEAENIYGGGMAGNLMGRQFI